MTKLLTIFGVTGQQGKALARHVLKTPSLRTTFTLRGVTRDASKAAAIALRQEGVEIVEADMDDRSTLDKAVAGSNVVFLMTSYWEKASAAVEIAQGKAIADACVAAGVDQIIWSSLPSITKLTGDQTNPIEHFESKALVEEYIRTLDIKATYFMPGWFMQNHLVFLKPQKDADGAYVLSMPWTATTELPLINIRDAGKFIAPALLDPDSYNGKRLTCATAFYTLDSMLDVWTRVTGTPVKLRTLGEGDQPGHEGVSASAHLQKHGYFGPDGKVDLAWTIGNVDEALTSWESFVREHKPWFT